MRLGASRVPSLGLAVLTGEIEIILVPDPRGLLRGFNGMMSVLLIALSPASRICPNMQEVLANVNIYLKVK